MPELRRREYATRAELQSIADRMTDRTAYLRLAETLTAFLARLRSSAEAQMIAGLKQMAVRAQIRGIKLIGATLTPFGNEAYMVSAWNPTRERHRAAVNDWIRESGAFDGVADFDLALRDPEHPIQMLPIYDCGDGLHPSDLGYCKLGDAIDLALFD